MRLLICCEAISTRSCSMASAQNSIVKNMLLHSLSRVGRASAGRYQCVSRGEPQSCLSRSAGGKQGFNITLERSFDPTAGEVDLFPQEITRALLNLISNGFYAATKRKTEANGGDYEPTLTAATKNLGDSVEIRIRDNGTGIPAGGEGEAVRQRCWNASLLNRTRGCAISAPRSTPTARFIRLLGRWNVLLDWHTTTPRKQGSTSSMRC